MMLGVGKKNINYVDIIAICYCILLGYGEPVCCSCTCTAAYAGGVTTLDFDVNTDSTRVAILWN